MFRCKITHAVLESVEPLVGSVLVSPDIVPHVVVLVLGDVLVALPVVFDFLALVHEERTADKTGGGTHCAVCHSAVSLLLLLVGSACVSLLAVALLSVILLFVTLLSVSLLWCAV